MTPVLNRREQRFAELIDEATGRHRRTDLDPELAPLVALTARLGENQPGGAPGEEYRLGLHAMLMATIDREGIGATAVIPTQRTQADRTATSSPSARRRRTRVAVLIGVTGALALSGVSQASVNALPGDPLYSVKRSTERAQLALAGSDLARGKLLFDYASTRLKEARVVEGNRQAGALQDMNAETTSAFRLLAFAAVDERDPTALDAIDAFLRDQTTAVGHETDVVWSRSRGLLAELKDRLEELRKVAAHSCGTAGADVYGPKPVDCLATSSANEKAGG